jgi:hypothetical protein
MLNDKIKENNKNKDIQKNTPNLPNPNMTPGMPTGNVVNRNDLTKNVDQRHRAGTVAAATRNNANAQSEHKMTVTVKLDASPKLKDLLTMEQTSQNDQEDNLNGFNAAPGRSPVHRSTFIKPKNDPGY